RPGPRVVGVERGPVGEGLRGGGLRAGLPGVAGRSRDGRGGAARSAGHSRQGGRPGRRPFRHRDRGARTQAGPGRPLLRWSARPDPRRPRPRGGHGGGRPGPLPRRPAGALAPPPGAAPPPPFRGVLPLPLAALRTPLPVLSNPANRGRAVTLTFDQFRYSWANAVSEEEARELHQRLHVAAPGKPLFQAAVANLNPGTELKVDTRNPDRAPLLIFTGVPDHAVPPAMSRAAYRKQRRNLGITEHVELADRGHSLTIDSGWQGVCERSLEFIGRVA